MTDHPTPPDPAQEQLPPALLLLGGMGQLPTAWQDVVSASPPDWRVRAPWLPGLKPTDTQGFDLERAVGELVGLCEREGFRRTHVVGVSLGAVVGLRLAAGHPELVDRLVLSGGQVAPPRLALRAQLAVLRRMPESRFRAQGLTRERAVAATEALAALDLHGDLAKVRAPTLVLVGSRDKAHQSATKALARGIPGARSRTLPGGPDLHTGSPAEFAAAVFGFLTEPEGPTG